MGIVGVAPNVRLASVRVVNDDGFIYPEYAVCGFVWAGLKHMDVTNNSYYVDPFEFYCDDQPDQHAAKEAVRRAVTWSTKQGVVHAAAAGNSGKALVSYDEIQTGEGDGIFYDNVQLETKTHSGGGYELTDTHGNNTRDAHNQGDPNTGQGPAGDLFLDSDDLWGSGSVSDRASAAVDAHYGATTTFNYYKNVLGRNGIWDNGQGAPSRVHFADGSALSCLPLSLRSKKGFASRPQVNGLMALTRPVPPGMHWSKVSGRIELKINVGSARRKRLARVTTRSPLWGRST